MDEKPKAITRLVWLWLFLGGIFFFASIVFLIFLIKIIFAEHTSEPGMWTACLTAFLVIIILCITFGLFSLKIWRSIKKGSKSAIKDGFILSTVSLLIFSGPFVFLVSMGLGYSFPPFVSGEILPYVLLFLILIFDTIIMVISLTPSVKAFVKTPLNNK